MKERYKIRGKVYYKVGEEHIDPSDRGIVDEIWTMNNPKGETFRLMIRRGRSSHFSLYDSAGKNIVKTYSITKMEG